jgi:hypothetical protein
MSATETFDLANATLEESMPWKPQPGRIKSKFSEDDKMFLTIRDASGKVWSFIPPTNPERQITERFFAGVIDIGKSIGVK